MTNIILEAYKNISEAKSKKQKVYSIVNNGLGYFLTVDGKNGNVYNVLATQLVDATFSHSGKDLYIQFK